MTLYVETSALLGWLVEEAAGSAAIKALKAASPIATSDLTFVECHRGLHRGVSTGRLRDEVARRAANRLRIETATWIHYSLSASVLLRASQPFPREPIRAPDALHLATAIVLREVRPDLGILSFDDRIVENARALGFPTVAGPVPPTRDRR